MSEWGNPRFETLKGQTLKSVEISPEKDRVEFETEDGKKFSLYHSQDCCETVVVSDVCGDLKDLIGSPLLVAEEAESDTTPESVKLEYQPESQTWTFYKLATIKGSVDIRWHGTSNGYYSESLSFAALN